MKYMLTTAAFCIGIMGAHAQTERTTPTPPQGNADCLTMITDQDWTAMGLNSEQMAKVKEIQAEQRKAMGKGNTTDRTSPTTGNVNYEAMVKNAITTVQYDKWRKWCDGHARDGMQRLDSTTTPRKNTSPMEEVDPK